MYIYIYTHTDHSGRMGDHTLQHTAAHWRTFSKLLSINTKATHCNTLTHLLKALVLSLKTSGNNLWDFASPEEGLVHLLDFAPLLQNLGPGRKLRVCVWLTRRIHMCIISQWCMGHRHAMSHTVYVCWNKTVCAYSLLYSTLSSILNRYCHVSTHVYCVWHVSAHVSAYMSVTCIRTVSAYMSVTCIRTVSAYMSVTCIRTCIRIYVCDMYPHYAQSMQILHTQYTCVATWQYLLSIEDSVEYRRLYTVCDMYAHSIRIDSMRIQCAYKTLCAYSLLYSTLSSFDTRIRILYCFDTRVDTVLFRHTNVQTVLFRNTWRYCLLSTYAHTVLYQYHHRQIARAPTDIYSYTSINIYT